MSSSMKLARVTELSALETTNQTWEELTMMFQLAGDYAGGLRTLPVEFEGADYARGLRTSADTAGTAAGYGQRKSFTSAGATAAGK